MDSAGLTTDQREALQQVLDDKYVVLLPVLEQGVKGYRSTPTNRTIELPRESQPAHLHSVQAHEVEESARRFLLMLDQIEPVIRQAIGFEYFRITSTGFVPGGSIGNLARRRLISAVEVRQAVARLLDDVRIRIAVGHGEGVDDRADY